MPTLTLDHLLIAVRDLDTASASYRRLLGRAPSWRGRHPTYGTANVLFRLDNCYLELLALSAAEGLAPSADAESDSPWLRALRAHLDARGEGLYGIAIGTDDIDATVSAIRARGLEVSDPADGDGVDLNTGACRSWRNARLPTEATRGVRAFFIEHCSPVGALPVAPPDADNGAFVIGVDHTVVASSDLASCVRVWRERVGLDLRRTLDGRNGRRLHFLRFGDSILELAGEGKPANPGVRDTLWGVAYNVGDVARAVERLRSEGVDVSDPRAGNAPGTIVADLKPGFSHDVRTLLIQKDLS